MQFHSSLLHPARKLFSVFAFLSLFAFLAAPIVAQPLTAYAEVNFSSPQAVHSAFGFLEGASAAGPSSAISSALQPALWRLGTYEGTDLASVYQQAVQAGAAVEYVVSDRFCYPTNQWCGNAPPYLNWPQFESMVGAAAVATEGMDVAYDVWNEPDNPQFWSGTQAQFFEAYLRAYRVLRNILGPNVLIGGPSSALPYDKAYLQAFLDYCVANGCQVNFLSWHELDDTDQAIAAISAHLRDARTSFLQNPAYASLQLQRIDINETTGPLSKDYPGAIVEYLYQLEQGGADGATRTCWNDSTGQSTCFNESLDGLLTPDGWPRASWWTYKAYSDGVGARVASTSTDSRVSILGTKSPGGGAAAQVLVGYYNSSAIQSSTPAPMSVQLTLTGLNKVASLTGASNIGMRLERIPATGESILEQLFVMWQTTVAWNGSTLTTIVPNIQSGDAYLLTLWNPASSGSN